MPHLPRDLKELDQLLAAVRDGELADDQQERLEKLLLESADARRYYLDYVDLCSTLRHYGGSLSSPVALERDRDANRPDVRSPGGGLGKVLLAAAAALVLGVALGIFFWPSSASPTAHGDGGVAVVTRSVGARWDDASGSVPRVGRSLRPGVYALESGLIEVDFYSGSSLILEGPAKFEPLSTQSVRLRGGKARVRVPPQAEGFALETPTSRLVYGEADYGVHVHPDGETEVHVFGGEVGLGEEDDARPARSLAHTQALSATVGGEVKSIAPAPEKFVSASQLEQHSSAESRTRFEAWKELRQRLAQDPRLLVYFPFDTADGDRVAKNAAGATSTRKDGAVVGCRAVEGRWPGKRALEFKRPSDRVRVHVEGTHDSLTLMAWVRIDALAREFNSLMLSDRWGVGGTHWQFTSEGRLEFAIRGQEQPREDEEVSADYESPVVLGPQDLGQWMHMAVTYDGQRGTVTHYVDGRIVSRQETDFDVKLRIGDAEIGNWGVPRTGDIYPIRAFNGRMDEFAVFSVALEREEVHALYQAGKPQG